MSSTPDPAAVLAQAWSEVFQSAPTADADFYALGGDSLTAARIATIVGERIGTVLEMDVFLMTELLDRATYSEVETAMLEFLADPAS